MHKLLLNKTQLSLMPEDEVFRGTLIYHLKWLILSSNHCRTNRVKGNFSSRCTTIIDLNTLPSCQLSRRHEKSGSRVMTLKNLKTLQSESTLHGKHILMTEWKHYLRSITFQKRGLRLFFMLSRESETGEQMLSKLTNW